MGLLDLFNNPEMQLGLGLLAAAGPTTDPNKTGFGARMQDAMGSVNAWKKQQAEEEYRKQQMQMQQMQMQEAQAKMAQEKARLAQEAANRDALKRAFTPMQGGQAMANGQGPTLENAGNLGRMPQFDPVTFFQQNPDADMSGFKSAIEVNQLLNPAKKLMNVPEGNVVLDERTGQPVYTAPKAPKEATPTELSRLLVEMNQLPQGSPLRSIYQNQISKLTTHAPGVSVTYGAPVAGVDASGNPIYFQPSKDGKAPSIIPGVAPPAREIPATIKSALAQNDVTIGKIDQAIKSVDAYPGAFGLQNVMGDTIQQRIDPKGVEPRAFVADIAGQKIHDRSGAAVTVGESERLKPYVPNANDHPDTVKKKLKLFRQEYAAMQQALQSGATIDQASRKQPSADPAAKTVSLADIAATAKASGKSTAEVTAALRAKGYTIGGQ